MCAGTPLASVLRNMLHYGDLSFRDFMEVAMYHPESGYYARARNPVGRTGDYVTSPLLSPAFSFALGGLIREFFGRAGDGESSIVDVGCGDGSLIHSLCAAADAGDSARFAGVDRALERVPDANRSGVAFVGSIPELARTPNQLVFANELFDAMPFA